MKRSAEERRMLTRHFFANTMSLQGFQAFREKVGDKRLGPPDPLRMGNQLGKLLAKGPFF